MNLKKIALTLALAGGLAITGIAPSTTHAAEPTKTQLQKQVKELKAQLQSKNTKIQNLESQLNNSYILKSVNSQLFYQGYLSPKKVTIGNVAVPTLLDYKGVYYAPVQKLASMQSLPYSTSSKTVYIGSKPEGQFMMDIKSLLPFNNKKYEVNGNMSLGGESYNKGIKLKANWEETYSINLGGKYTTIQGLIGHEGNGSSTANIKITDENDNVLFESEISKDDLPKELDIDVKGVKNIKIYVNTWGSFEVSLVNLTIK